MLKDLQFKISFLINLTKFSKKKIADWKEETRLGKFNVKKSKYIEFFQR